mgnify:CR=1 FL=1
MPDTICKVCGNPMAKHIPAVGYYYESRYCPSDEKESFDGVKCPPELSEGDLSDGRNEAHIKEEKERLE